ncbi:conserved hypothetical protein [Methanocaldococcus jannaschii DSM 2661]|uniref:Uncharacterized protein MJ0437 n=1 Tax=Methanocaldococcus jannaschii (strain ATCC 43067 / DSM 2661 / JAL-1 / JCM 10045 / NBRC 100440) TaxID=243232 RepID=Y437_METJA|nr:DUF4040 domain-containing protein [Methanocaldococcus jannaschii]Q57879.1 RecName: Full=Uncharacterized protein MJ0437 [Methanocaldococcus jannaschii DSM 2661]AAB98425.1 conserved hypothetical protein [Methanocaldococcus jannaschii DSM 2661]
MEIIHYIVIIMTLLSSLASLLQRDLIKCIILSGFAGLCMAYLYYALLAPDVALTEAILGGAILPALFAFTVRRTQRIDE